VGRLERATLLFSGIQRTESVGEYDEGEKSGENFLLGKFTFARAFGTACSRGAGGTQSHRTIEVCSGFCKNTGKLLLC